jgi:hypothetical protein
MRTGSNDLLPTPTPTPTPNLTLSAPHVPAPRRHGAESPNAKRLRFPSSEESGDFALEFLHQLFQCHLAAHLAAVRVDVCVCIYVSICVRVRARSAFACMYIAREYTRARANTHTKLCTLNLIPSHTHHIKAYHTTLRMT